MAQSARTHGGCIWLSLLALVVFSATRTPAIYADAKAAHRPPTSSRHVAAETLLTEMAQAAGASTLEMEIALARFRECIKELHAADTVDGDCQHKARVLHEFLHHRVLRGPYQVSATSVPTALSGGPYNCTSGTALLLALAIEFGLQVDAVAAPGHVWCRVSDEGSMFDIETTQPDWSTTAPSAETSPRQGRTLDTAGLVALVHYNQGVRLHRQGRFVEAIEANRLALRLDPRCEQARDNLRAAIHNWSLMLTASGQGVEALPAWAAGLASDPESLTLRADIQGWLRREVDCPVFARQ